MQPSGVKDKGIDEGCNVRKKRLNVGTTRQNKIQSGGARESLAASPKGMRFDRNRKIGQGVLGGVKRGQLVV